MHSKRGFLIIQKWTPALTVNDVYAKITVCGELYLYLTPCS